MQTPNTFRRMKPLPRDATMVGQMDVTSASLAITVVGRSSMLASLKTVYPIGTTGVMAVATAYLNANTTKQSQPTPMTGLATTVGHKDTKLAAQQQPLPTLAATLICVPSSSRAITPLAPTQEQEQVSVPIKASPMQTRLCTGPTQKTLLPATAFAQVVNTTTPSGPTLRTAAATRLGNTCTTTARTRRPLKTTSGIALDADTTPARPLESTATRPTRTRNVATSPPKRPTTRKNEPAIERTSYYGEASNNSHNWDCHANSSSAYCTHQLTGHTFGHAHTVACSC